MHALPSWGTAGVNRESEENISEKRETRQDEIFFGGRRDFGRSFANAIAHGRKATCDRRTIRPCERAGVRPIPSCAPVFNPLASPSSLLPPREDAPNMIGIVHRPPCTWTKEHSQSPTACSSWTTPRCSRTTTTTLRLHGGRAARRAAPAELFHPTSRSPLVCDATCDVDPEKQDPQVRNLKLECIICPVAVYPPVHVHAHVRGRAASRTPNAPDVRMCGQSICELAT